MPQPRLPQQRKLLGAAILSDHAWSEIAKAMGITKREIQIIQGVFDNRHEVDIAERLRISPHTVHMHLNRLYKKLIVTSRTELVLRIVQEMVTLTLSETAVLPPICPRHRTDACCLHKNPPVPPPNRSRHSITRARRATAFHGP
ncbi:MAG: helix-turn-helix transcriptional regulator [Verrucomicrobiota bacterium]